MIAANHQNEDIVGGLFGFTLFGAVVYLVVDRFIQKRKVKKLNELSLRAELASLKTQINPHFFFNTLNNLYGLTVEKSDLAPEMILKLSDMMRYTIYEGEKPLVPIKDEITYLENYIELQKIRFHREIDIKFNYILEHKGCEVPPLLFIIFLENAFKHGAETLTENAYIHMKLTATREQVYFEILNNFEQDEEKEKGIGLKNLRRRLQLLYPNEHSVFSGETESGVYKATLKISLP